MNKSLPSDLLPRARQILLPLVMTLDDRETLLADAFYVDQTRLYSGIDRAGAPNVFTTRCLTRLLDYGCLAQGEHSLARLLLAARYGCGVDMHPEIDELASLANRLCQSEPKEQQPSFPMVPASAAAPLQTIGLYSNDCLPVIEWLADANPEVAAQCATRSGAALNSASLNAARERLRSLWIPWLTDLKRAPMPRARAAIGRALGLMKLDNRPGVGVVNGLPDIDWVEIPGGEFHYGDNKTQKLALPTFHISRYPVTYAQFQPFLDDPAGIADPRWFEELAGGEDEHQAGEEAFKFSNHPRERVSWYQAMAFCRWLSWRLGGGYDLKKIDQWAVRLPTEFEWEKAARGTNGRLYPCTAIETSRGPSVGTSIERRTVTSIPVFVWCYVVPLLPDPFPGPVRASAGALAPVPSAPSGASIFFDF